MINQDNELKFFKTHNAFWNWGGGKYTFTDEKNSLGVIHIVRDPRNVITSVLNYYHKQNYNHALEFLTENKVFNMFRQSPNVRALFEETRCPE